jgi:hypothetical protein
MMMVMMDKQQMKNMAVQRLEQVIRDIERAGRPLLMWETIHLISGLSALSLGSYKLADCHGWLATVDQNQRLSEEFLPEVEDISLETLKEFLRRERNAPLKPTHTLSS